MKGNANACETVAAMLVDDVVVQGIVHPVLRLVIGSSDVGTINAFHHATEVLVHLVL